MRTLFDVIRRNRVTAIIGAVVCLLALFIGWNLFRSQTDPRLEGIRQRGYPVTLAELDAWYRAVPPAENAALVYLEAQALPIFSESQSSSGGYSTASTRASEIFAGTNSYPPRGQVLNAEGHRALAELLATNQTALALLHTVRTSSPARYPIDLRQGFNSQLSHLAGVKPEVSLLAAEAMLHSADGDAEQTTEALLAAGRVADSLAEEPLLISQLVRIACCSIVLSRLERVLSATPLTDDQLARLQLMVQQAETPRSFARALAGERASGLAVFSDRKMLAGAFAGMSQPPMQSENLRVAALVGVLKATGLFQKDRAFYLDVMATNIAAAELPFPERIRASQQTAMLFGAGGNRLRIVSNLLLPALARAHIRDTDLVARLRAAHVALALERFRQAHDHALPIGLQELVPSCLPSVPADPYDGQPLRYKQRDGGYVVYSIGSDGRDDGGAEPTSRNLQGARDITFIVVERAR